MKNNLLCNDKKRILWLSRTFDGSVHDKKITDEQPLRFPAGITLWQDTGFLGHNPKNITVKMPAKKPKGKENKSKKTEKYPLFVSSWNMQLARLSDVGLLKNASRSLSC